MKDNLSSKERVLAAIDHRPTDRTPITFDAEREVYDALYGHLNVSTKEALFDALGVDTWMVLPSCHPTPQIKDSPESTSVWGYRTRLVHYQGGSYQELSYSPLAGKDDLCDIENHPWPSPDVFDFSAFPKQIEEHSGRAIIGVFTWGAYFLATYMRGMENLLLDFALNENYAGRLIGKISEVMLGVLDTMLDSYGDGIDIIYMADDYCSQISPLFSPDAFKRFVSPYLTKAVEATHKHGKKFLLHCCGAVRPLLPMIIEAGVDMLEPIQIRANGMAPEDLKRDFGRNLCFYGGMDLQETLSSGTPQEVSDEAKRLIDILGKDGGYIIGPGHTYIQPDTPIENIISMYETARNYRS